MKKLIFFALIAVLAFTGTANALIAKSSQSNNSDELWTEIRMSVNEPNMATKGSIVVFDATLPVDDAAYYVVLSSASTDNYKVAGVVQQDIATYDRGLALTRGKGVISIPGGVTSLDRIYTTSRKGQGGTIVGTNAASTASHDKHIAFALKSNADATTDCYITVM